MGRSRRHAVGYNNGMAMRKLEHLMDEAVKLPPDQQLELAQHLIALARRKKYAGKPADLNRFAGTVKLTEDPLEYQKRIRAEWP